MAESITVGAGVAQEASGSQRRTSQVGIGAFCRRFSTHRLPMIGVIVVGLLTLISIVGPWLITISPISQDVEAVLDPPSAAHLFGTDELGRDIFARVVYGGRISLQVGIVSTLIALVIGTALGLVAGYWGGSLLDNAIMRGIDALLAFPSLVLAIAITAVLGPNLQNAMLAIGIVNIPSFARLVRGQVLTIRPMEFVEAARTLGATPLRIIVLHVLPNTLGPIVVLASLRLAFAVLSEASLSFLGLGAQP